MQHIDLVPDHPRLAGRRCPEGPARAIAPVADRRRAGARQRERLRGGVLRPLSLRLERAVLADRRALPVHQGAEARGVRPRTRPGRNAEPGRRTAAGGRRRRARNSTACWPAPASRRRRRCRRRTSSGCRRSATSARRRASRPTARANRCPTRRTRRKVLEAYRRAIALVGRAALRRVRGAAARGAGRQPVDEGRVAPAGRRTRCGQAATTEAVDAFKRLVELDPADANSFVSIAGVYQMLGKLAEAQANAEMGLEKAGDVRAKTSACEVLVKIALARKDAGGRQALRRRRAAGEPEFPLPDYVEGLILHGRRSASRRRCRTSRTRSSSCAASSSRSPSCSSIPATRSRTWDARTRRWPRSSRNWRSRRLTCARGRAWRCSTAPTAASRTPRGSSTRC